MPKTAKILAFEGGVKSSPTSSKAPSSYSSSAGAPKLHRGSDVARGSRDAMAMGSAFKGLLLQLEEQHGKEVAELQAEIQQLKARRLALASGVWVDFGVVRRRGSP